MISFSGCSENKQDKPSSDIINLDTWLGDYEFHEYAPPDQNKNKVHIFVNDILLGGSEK